MQNLENIFPKISLVVISPIIELMCVIVWRVSVAIRSVGREVFRARWARWAEDKAWVKWSMWRRLFMVTDSWVCKGV